VFCSLLLIQAFRLSVLYQIFRPSLTKGGPTFRHRQFISVAGEIPMTAETWSGESRPRLPEKALKLSTTPVFRVSNRRVDSPAG
jgi:hypothetical protein